MSDVIGETATSLLPLSTANKDAQQDVTNAIISYVRLRGNPVAVSFRFIEITFLLRLTNFNF